MASRSQSVQNYPQGYFRDPLDIPIQLVSNFGELRPNHFHMGLDIRTQGRENLAVHAAAEGYVSRIKIEKNGYGNAIYITHPNGFTTLYAHLNSFYPALAAYVKKKQYAEQTWEQDFALPPGNFPVKKGQFIAYSGNTGGSAGPHLHFEIRDTKTGNNLNPLLFGFAIRDDRAPLIRALYWYDRRYSTYTTSARPVPLIRKGNEYTTTANVLKVNSPAVSFGINTEDLSNSSGFNMGIYQAELYMDDSLLNAFTLDNFSYTDTRYVNACVDYSKLMREKRYVQYLTQLPGNRLNIFTPTSMNGMVILTDTLAHRIHINVSDSYGNTVSIRFAARLSNPQERTAYADGTRILLPNQENSIMGNNVRAFFSRNAFYDVVPFLLSEKANPHKNSASDWVALHNYTVPVHDFYTVQLRTTLPAGDPLRRSVVMQLTSGSSKDLAKGSWEGDWMTARFNRLGNLQLLIDTLPPLIRPFGWKDGSVLTAKKTLILQGKDDLGEIDSFRAELDGHWLLFAKHRDSFVYTFDEHCGRGQHILKVLISDLAGNITRKTYRFTR